MANRYSPFRGNRFALATGPRVGVGHGIPLGTYQLSSPTDTWFEERFQSRFHRGPRLLLTPPTSFWDDPEERLFTSQGQAEFYIAHVDESNLSTPEHIRDVNNTEFSFDDVFITPSSRTQSENSPRTEETGFASLLSSPGSEGSSVASAEFSPEQESQTDSDEMVDPSAASLIDRNYLEDVFTRLSVPSEADNVLGASNGHVMNSASASRLAKSAVYSVQQLLSLRKSQFVGCDISKFSQEAVKDNILKLKEPRDHAILQSYQRSRELSSLSTESNESLVYPANQAPNRQPKGPPDSLDEQKKAGFVRFLKEHASPPNRRVTAGGRIVPMPPLAPPPTFDPENLGRRLDVQRSPVFTAQPSSLSSVQTGTTLIHGIAGPSGHDANIGSVMEINPSIFHTSRVPISSFNEHIIRGIPAINPQELYHQSPGHMSMIQPGYVPIQGTGDYSFSAPQGYQMFSQPAPGANSELNQWSTMQQVPHFPPPISGEPTLDLASGGSNGPARLIAERERAYSECMREVKELDVYMAKNSDRLDQFLRQNLVCKRRELVIKQDTLRREIKSLNEGGSFETTSCNPPWKHAVIESPRQDQSTHTLNARAEPWTPMHGNPKPMSSHGAGVEITTTKITQSDEPSAWRDENPPLPEGPSFNDLLHRAYDENQWRDDTPPHSSRLDDHNYAAKSTIDSASHLVRGHEVNTGMENPWALKTPAELSNVNFPTRLTRSDTSSSSFAPHEVDYTAPATSALTPSANKTRAFTEPANLQNFNDSELRPLQDLIEDIKKTAKSPKLDAQTSLGWEGRKVNQTGLPGDGKNDVSLASPKSHTPEKNSRLSRLPDDPVLFPSEYQHAIPISMDRSANKSSKDASKVETKPVDTWESADDAGNIVDKAPTIISRDNTEHLNIGPKIRRLINLSDQELNCIAKDYGLDIQELRSVVHAKERANQESGGGHFLRNMLTLERFSAGSQSPIAQSGPVKDLGEENISGSRSPPKGKREDNKENKSFGGQSRSSVCPGWDYGAHTIRMSKTPYSVEPQTYQAQGFLPQYAGATTLLPRVAQKTGLGDSNGKEVIAEPQQQGFAATQSRGDMAPGVFPPGYGHGMWDSAMNSSPDGHHCLAEDSPQHPAW